VSNEFAALEDQVEDLLNRLERAERENEEVAWINGRLVAAEARAQELERNLRDVRALRVNDQARAQKAEEELAIERGAAGIALPTIKARLQKAEAVVEAARALHERVEMDESVGICLSERVESLALGAALTAYDEPPTEQA
jgi:chromosome segregation ATPase